MQRGIYFHVETARIKTAERRSAVRPNERARALTENGLCPNADILPLPSERLEGIR